MERTRIGGPGIVVNVDEMKIGKSKHYSNHRTVDICALVGIERTAEKNSLR